MTTRFPVGAAPRATKRTTVRDYDADLQFARAIFDERTAFALAFHDDPDIDEQIQKTIDDALNNEWQRGITIELWVERAMEATSQRPRR
ncbi:MAG TPA: hypothetical protein VJO13_06220 [Ktedonobacterales bacterium]|nr:hypothetical protein [Ktedonobacterales bacterium]